MSNPETKKWLKLAAVAAVVAALFAVASRRHGPAGTGSLEPASPPVEEKAQANPPTEDGYVAAMKAALGDYLELRGSLPKAFDTGRSDKELVPLRAAKAAVSEVVVTKDRRSAHLALVLALARIEQGMRDGDAAVWESGEDKLDEYLEDNGWLMEAESQPRHESVD